MSIYTNNRYQSLDLDFVTSEQMAKLAAIFEPLGFVRGEGRYLEHGALLLTRQDLALRHR